MAKEKDGKKKKPKTGTFSELWKSRPRNAPLILQPYKNGKFKQVALEDIYPNRK